MVLRPGSHDGPSPGDSPPDLDKLSLGTILPHLTRQDLMGQLCLRPTQDMRFVKFWVYWLPFGLTLDTQNEHFSLLFSPFEGF
jgi:hypothetical protein